MKVYFSGSHSLGKTTLARYVSQSYKLPFVTETARMILSEKELQIDRLRYDIDLVDQYEKDVFERQFQEESKHNSFVSDRSVIDVLAYSANHTRVLPDLLKSPLLQKYLDLIKLNNSIIFFVRPCKATMKSDGVREHLSWDGVVAIDSMIKLLLEQFELRYFQINMDNMQERVRLVDSVLSLYKP